MKLLTLLAVSLLLFSACKGKEKAAEKGPHKTGDACCPPKVSGNTLSGVVLETMDVAGYTYVRIKTDKEETWAAAPKTAVKTGDTVVLSDPMPMKNYASKSLNRTFETIYFSGALTHAKEWAAGHAAGMGQAAGGAEGAPAHPVVAAKEMEIGKIEKAAGGMTVAEILAQADKLQGKPVVFRGKIVKANYGIMQKTWLHVRDGSSGNSGDELTVTTAAESPKLGDIVLVKGPFAKDKDIGMGYKFKGFVEDASVTVEGK